jgi:predicted TIM-barrel fold metal-dependent hydrolase
MAGKPFRGAYYRSLAEAQARVVAGPIEAILEPELPIIDPHHHLLEGRHGRYLLAEFLADLASGGGHNIRQSVFVESSTHYRDGGPQELRSVGEVEFATSIATSTATEPVNVCAAIVSHAELSVGDRVRAVLEAQLAAGRGHLRGVRDLVQWDGSEIARHSTRRAPPHKLADPAFRAGFNHLAALGLSCDLWVFHPQLPELVELAAAYPDTTIVLDHAGTPLGVEPYQGRPEVFAQWRESLRALAAQSNVVVKIGGLGMPYTGFDLHFRPLPPGSEELARAWRPYIETCIELFGVSRCMFESNFPADKQTCGYGTLWNAFKRVTAGCSATEKTALYSNTARRTYRLE